VGRHGPRGDSILAILPIFHGFGLGVCVNAAFMAGGKSILVPQFSAEIVARLLKSARPNLLVGVPTLYDALSKDPSLARSDLSCLRACFSGADTLPRPVKERFEHWSPRTAARSSCSRATGSPRRSRRSWPCPWSEYREGSIGIPVPRHGCQDLPLRHHRGAAGRRGKARSASPARR